MSLSITKVIILINATMCPLDEVQHTTRRWQAPNFISDPLV